jgi:hypothetical protein
MKTNSEALAHLQQAFTLGLRPASEICGYHACSKETVLALLSSGVFPGLNIQAELPNYNRGDIFFWPKDLGSYTQCGQPDLYNPDAGTGIEALDDTIQYGGIVGRKHALATYLGVDIRKHPNSINIDVDAIDNPKEIAPLVALGFSETLVLIRLVQAYFYRGFVVCLDRAILQAYAVEDCSPDDGWRVITNGNRVPYHYIAGIFPLGHHEHQFYVQHIKKK